MNAGKSAHIILQVHNLISKGQDVIVLKPSLDDRDYGVIKSRAIKDSLDAVIIKNDFQIFDYIADKKPDYVFVDEINFLTEDKIEELARIVDDLDIPVFCYGLLLDFTGTLFAGSKKLVEMADSIRELKAKCSRCSNKATHHIRKLDGKYVFDGEVISTGDVDVYDSVCRKCFYKIKNNK